MYNKVNEKYKVCFLFSSECPAGYTGQSCFYKCHYPSYGQDCAESCDCPTELCDYLFGCPNPSTNMPGTYFKESKCLYFGEQ